MCTKVCVLLTGMHYHESAFNIAPQNPRPHDGRIDFRKYADNIRSAVEGTIPGATYSYVCVTNPSHLLMNLRLAYADSSDGTPARVVLCDGGRNEKALCGLKHADPACDIIIMTRFDVRFMMPLCSIDTTRINVLRSCADTSRVVEDVFFLFKSSILKNMIRAAIRVRDEPDWHGIIRHVRPRYSAKTHYIVSDISCDIRTVFWLDHRHGGPPPAQNTCTNHLKMDDADPAPHNKRSCVVLP